MKGVSKGVSATACRAIAMTTTNIWTPMRMTDGDPRTLRRGRDPMSTCKTCGASIIWATTKNGKKIPLELDMVLGGNIDLVDGVATVVPPDYGVKRMVTHFSRCPGADQHRRR